MRAIQHGYFVLATVLSSLSLFFVSISSSLFVYSPEVPEELLKK
ncbi:cyclic lactone autoinducer peptide [Paenibacillus sp. WLX1005]